VRVKAELAAEEAKLEAGREFKNESILSCECLYFIRLY